MGGSVLMIEANGSRVGLTVVGVVVAMVVAIESASPEVVAVTLRDGILGSAGTGGGGVGDRRGATTC